MDIKDKEFWKRNAVAVAGMLLFSAGINLFMVPAGLYNGNKPDNTYIAGSICTY